MRTTQKKVCRIEVTLQLTLESLELRERERDEFLDTSSFLD